MPTTEGWLADTQATVLDGMNRGREPELISEQQAHLLRNLSIRGGRARSRPSFVHRATLPAGLLQGGAVFRTLSSVLVSIDGKIYTLDPDTGATAEPTELSGWLTADEAARLSVEEQAILRDARRNSPKQPRAHFCETVGTLIVQDGQSYPFLYDGDAFRRAKGDEVPVGTAMAYGNGRLAVAVNEGRAVRLGDIRQDEHQSELKFTETYSLLGGGDFSFPSPVRALGVLPVIDSASGQGSLIVGCAHSVHSLKTQITQRDLWAEVGFETVLLPTRGVAGAGALVAVNQDLYFRSGDGLRSLRTSTADYDAPGLAPLSVEVRHRFDHDTPFLLEDAGVVYFDNRVLATHSPAVYANRSLAHGLIALNFDGLSGRGQKSPPAFDGEWDGLVIASVFTGLVRGVERCFILGRDLAGHNGLWELQREVEVPAGAPPTQVLETRLLFGNGPGVLKTLRRADLQFSGLTGPLTVRVYFRPDKFPYWVNWDTFTATAIPPAKDTLRAPHAQYRPRFSTRSPVTIPDPQTNRPVCVGTGFQVRVEIEGRARLDQLQVFQEPIAEPAYAAPTPNAALAQTIAPEGSTDPAFWYTYPVSPLSGIG
jgi:hypothetical protein